MMSRPTHPPDDAHGPGDAGTAELAPVIATIEELVQGIARELSASLDPQSLLAQVAAGTPGAASSLAHDLDAAGARIRELREQLWYAHAATRTAMDSTPQERERQDARLARYRDLEPLFMRLESQIRQARQEQRLRERRDEVEPGRMKSPWLPEQTLAGRGTTLGDGRSAVETVSSPDRVDENEGRQRWLWVAAAATLLIATAIVSWLATRDVGHDARSVAPAADRPASVANPSAPVVASPSAATAAPARPSEPPAIDGPVESSSGATATSGSFPARPPSDLASAAAVPTPSTAANAPAPARPPESPVATPSGDPSARDAVGNTARLDASRPPEPTESRAAVDAVATAAQSPATGTRVDADAPPAVPPPSAAATQPSDAARTPPAEVIARATVSPAPPEDVARAAPPEEVTRTDAPTDTVAPSDATPLSRPAAVVTRVQPRMLVEMISADMVAGVELRVRVDRTGRATDVRAVSGPVALRAPAEDTVRRWTFSPALSNGEPTDGELRVTLTFGASPRNLRLPRRSP